MGWLRQLGLVLIGVAIAAPTSAQSARQAEQTELSPIVILAEPSLRPLAREVARVLQRRTGRPHTLGGDPPVIAEAVAAGELAMVERDGVILLALAGQDGRTVTSHLSVSGSVDSARTVALAVQSLADEAEVEVEPLPPPPPANTYVFLEYEPEHVERRMARPSVFLRLLAGYSLSQKRVLVGPGAGFGLCVGTSCLSVEADMPLVPERHVLAGQDIRMRIVNAALRAQFRPIVRGDFSAGITVGLLTRILSATMVSTGERATASDFGFRGSLEGSWRFAGPFEWVVEAGADYVFDPPRLFGLVRENGFFPWVTSSLRMRPFE